MKYHVANQGDMIDYICWKYYGDESGYVEAVLEHPKNYRLCDRNEILPVGTIVWLPDVTIEEPIKRLWD